jgi:23S rRNA pseudouridine1911/1915/1917 synthase
VSKIRQLTVRRAQAGSTLLEFLSVQLKISKKNAKRMIDARVVFINTRRTWMAKHKLSAGDRIEIPAESEASVEKPKRVWPLYEDENLLVANKPPGIVSDGESSVESLLRIERSSPKLRAVHRLDKDTSGCLLFALHEEAREQAIAAFEEMKVGKKYLVIAIGKVPPDLELVDQAIDGKSARTRFRILEMGAHATLLEAELETGRMHQIRRHLAAVQLGIAGDKQYGKQEISSSLLRTISRQMLHAWKLEIPSLKLKVTAPLPKDFCEALEQFGLEQPKN